MSLMSTGFALSLLLAPHAGLGVEQDNMADEPSTVATESRIICENAPTTCAGILGNFILESNVDENGFVVLDTESSWGSVK